jgi:hypothetical protein
VILGIGAGNVPTYSTKESALRPFRPRVAVFAVIAAMSLALAVPAAASADFGAIAVNPNTSASGVSFGYNKKSNAKRRAKRECPGRCRITVWVRNGCAATVVNDRGFYSAAARKKRRAIRRAHRKAPGPDDLVAWTCSG